MPTFKSLSVTTLPKSTMTRSTCAAYFAAKLEEQKLILADPDRVQTVQRWTKVDGERQATTKQQAIRPW